MAHYLHLPSVRYPHMATTSNFLNHTLCIHDTLCLRSTHVFVSPPIQWLICPHQITGYINCKISHCITEDNTGLSWPTYHAILSPHTTREQVTDWCISNLTARHMVSASAVDSRKSETCHRLDGTVCYNTRVWHNDVLAIKHSNVPCHVSKKKYHGKKECKGRKCIDTCTWHQKNSELYNAPWLTRRHWQPAKRNHKQATYY